MSSVITSWRWWRFANEWWIDGVMHYQGPLLELLVLTFKEKRRILVQIVKRSSETSVELQFVQLLEKKHIFSEIKNKLFVDINITVTIAVTLPASFHIHWRAGNECDARYSRCRWLCSCWNNFWCKGPEFEAIQKPLILLGF